MFITNFSSKFNYLYNLRCINHWIEDCFKNHFLKAHFSYNTLQMHFYKYKNKIRNIFRFVYKTIMATFLCNRIIIFRFLLETFTENIKIIMTSSENQTIHFHKQTAVKLSALFLTRVDSNINKHVYWHTLHAKSDILFFKCSSQISDILPP